MADARLLSTARALLGLVGVELLLRGGGCGRSVQLQPPAADAGVTPADRGAATAPKMSPVSTDH